jgi:hypothetical protein
LVVAKLVSLEAYIEHVNMHLVVIVLVIVIVIVLQLYVTIVNAYETSRANILKLFFAVVSYDRSKKASLEVYILHGNMPTVATDAFLARSIVYNCKKFRDCSCT